VLHFVLESAKHEFGIFNCLLKEEPVMSDEQTTTETKPTGRASSAIWAGIKYGVLAYAIWYAAKWLGWV
jgi:hypothetical protein